MKGVEIEFLEMSSLSIPVYNEDIEKSNGLPKDVEMLCQKIEWADSLVICTPEYNGTIPGGLKNVIDWVSRKRPNPMTGKYVMLLAASPGPLGGVRSLWHTRVPFEAVGCYVYPQMHGVSKAHEAFDAEGNLKDAQAIGIIDKLLKQYVEHLQRFVG